MTVIIHVFLLELLILATFGKINAPLLIHREGQCSFSISGGVLQRFVSHSKGVLSWLIKSWKKSHFLLRIDMDGSSWFGSNLTLGLHLREISQLMELYPQIKPNITKVVEPLKAYKWRHSHHEQGGEIINKKILF